MAITVFDEFSSANGTFVIRDGVVKGGYHTCASEAAISALSSSVLSIGMAAYSQLSSILYLLNNLTASGQFANGTWSILTSPTPAGSGSWAAVQAVSGSNLVLTGTTVVDGYQTVAGDRIGAVRQTLSAQNGIYTVAVGAWPRAADAASSSMFAVGKSFNVVNGLVNSGTLWLETSFVTTVDSDPINFEANSAGSSVPPATSTTLGTIVLSGDLTGTAQLPRVGGLLGNPLLNTTVFSDQVYSYNGGQKRWDPTTFGGNVSGSVGTLMVRTVNGYNALTDGLVTGTITGTPAFQSTFASGSTTPVLALVGSGSTSDGSTWRTLLQVTSPTGSLARWTVSVVGRQASSLSNTLGWGADLGTFHVQKGTGSVVLTPNVPAVINQVPATGLGNCSVQAITSSNGNDLLVQVLGSGSSFPMDWSCAAQLQRVF